MPMLNIINIPMLDIINMPTDCVQTFVLKFF